MASRQYLTQVGTRVVDQAFNKLRKITRTYDVNAGAITAERINDEVFLSYGTEDEEFKSALLVDRSMQNLSVDKSAYVGRLTEVYQEFTKGEKVSVGEDQILKLEDGRTALVRKYVALAEEAEGLAAAIGTVVDGRACQDVKINKQGVGAETVETYISAGKLAESNSYKNNNSLLIKTLVYFNQVPPTPAGFELSDTQVKDTDGVPTYTYQFSKGLGEISRRTEYNQSDDQGTTGATIVTITHLTAPGSGDPTSSPGSGFVKVLAEPIEEDGYRTWRVIYAKGVGKVAEQINPRTDGMRQVTWISLGTRIAPTGIIVGDDWRLADGYKVYTVSTMQTAAGGADPTSSAFTYERYVDFTYPGRVKAFTETYDSKTMLDVFESPPVTTKVLATVSISYQTADTIGTLTPALWNPTDWATIKAQWVGSYGKQTSRLIAKPGYRSVSATPVTLAAGNTSCMGSVIYAATTAKITVTGGPADPGGNDYTLHAELELAFAATDGTKYYRRIQIHATIPAQAALPV